MRSVLVVGEMVMGDGGSNICSKWKKDHLGFQFPFYYARVKLGQPLRSTICDTDYDSGNDSWSMSTSRCLPMFIVMDY